MAIEPPGTPRQRERLSAETDAADAMRAGEPTTLLPAAQPAPRSGPRLPWPRTLRWRLTLSYALVLGLMLVALGVALNLFIGRALYATEFGFFQTEAVAAVSGSQARFDTLTLGRSATCADAIPYEAAFQQAIADPITASHPGSIQGVYLLDASGAVLAPLSAQTGNAATRYLQPRQLANLAAEAEATFDPSATGAGSQRLASAGYFGASRSP
ncbi:MAG TPA: hypothetical protein VFX31_00900, partial [Ktedonobacterales bacterium]|nr:hypothetical protein [Ktedonobacterales bacterium]